MAVRAGNTSYNRPQELPEAIPVFPLSGALLLPGGHLPLNIFEPRYLAMVDYALSDSRLIGMAQPRLDDAGDTDMPELCSVGCVGRIVQFAETGDGRYQIALAGVCRFLPESELECATPFRQFAISADRFAADFTPGAQEESVDRKALLETFRAYLDANGLEADWESIDAASNAGLVTALSMMSPWGPAEKQALLEAPDLKTRADTLIAIAELSIAGDDNKVLQ